MHYHWVCICETISILLTNFTGPLLRGSWEQWMSLSYSVSWNCLSNMLSLCLWTGWCIFWSVECFCWVCMPFEASPSCFTFIVLHKFRPGRLVRWLFHSVSAVKLHCSNKGFHAPLKDKVEVKEGEQLPRLHISSLKFDQAYASNYLHSSDLMRWNEFWEN